MARDIDTYVEVVDHASDAVKTLSAAEAFRKYDWLREVPLTNISGNFRGIVIDSRWKVVYNVSSDIQSAASNFAILLSLAEESRRAASPINQILASNDSWETKASKLCLQISGICTRVLFGVAASAV